MLCCLPPVCEEWFDNDRLRVFNAMYAGKAVSLHARFRDYLNIRNLSPRVEGFIRQHRPEGQSITFIYAPCDAEILLKVEGALIDSFGPSANARRENVGRTVQGRYKDPIKL